MSMRCLRLLALLMLAVPVTACGADSTPTTAPTTGPRTGDSACVYTRIGDAAKDVDVPPGDPALNETATIKTNSGDVGLTLAIDSAPCTVSSFLSLAKQGYFDGTQCHRLTTQGIFVLQCGDPTATGMGGPGYSFDDELSGKERYSAGTVAMANSGPDTNGSQFFLVYADSTDLPPAYTVFGSMDSRGLDVVTAIAQQGTATGTSGGPPKDKVVIDTVS